MWWVICDEIMSIVKCLDMNYENLVENNYYECYLDGVSYKSKMVWKILDVKGFDVM